MRTLWQDLRYAARTLRHSPGFVVVAVLVLALGIGANTAIFSIANAVLFRPLPVADPEQLRFLHVTLARYPDTVHGVPYRDYQYICGRRDVFAQVAGWTGDRAKLGSGLDAEQVRGETVTVDYFDLLGVKPMLGRTFVASDDAPGAEPAILISHSLWKRRFDGDPKAIGTTLDVRATNTLAGFYSKHRRAYTIIGVMPPEFRGISNPWEPAEIWTSLFQRASDRRDTAKEQGFDQPSPALEDSISLLLIARLNEGVKDAQVQPAVLAAERHMLDRLDLAERREARSLVYARSLRTRLPFDQSGKVVPARLAMALMAVSAMVLLIAATNLAGILMARGVTRRGEVAVRLALGAGRWRVARQVLTESLLLSTPGGLLGLLLARTLVELFLAYLPTRLGGGLSMLRLISLDVPIDLRVLLFTAAVGIGAGLLVGLTPALQALKTDLLSALSGGGAVVPHARARLRHWIVIPQVCLSLALLLCAGVLVRTLLRAEFIDRGFEPDRVVYATFDLPARGIQRMTSEQRTVESERRRLLYARLLERARASPNVTDAALTLLAPADGRFRTSVVTRSTVLPGQNRWVHAGEVGAGYFEAMGIPVLRGRTFDGRDTASTARVAIVCEALARLLWPGQDPIGQYVARYDPKNSQSSPTWLQVVGVVKEIKPLSFEDQTSPFIYTPLEQQSSPYATTLVVRGRASTAELKDAVARAIVQGAPEVEVPLCTSLADAIGEVLYPRRVAAAILALSGVIGLLISMVGLYGVASYSAAQRTREIGIRAALGAQRVDIVLLMLREGVRMLAAGVVLGVGLAFAGIRVTSSTVVAIPAMDALTLVGVPVLLGAVMLGACYLPARRAARVNPIEVLRGL